MSFLYWVNFSIFSYVWEPSVFLFLQTVLTLFHCLIYKCTIVYIREVNPLWHVLQVFFLVCHLSLILLFFLQTFFSAFYFVPVRYKIDFFFPWLVRLSVFMAFDYLHFLSGYCFLISFVSIGLWSLNSHLEDLCIWATVCLCNVCLKESLPLH